MSHTYLIIGATSGIGAALAEELSEQGHRIISISRSEEPQHTAIDQHHQVDITEQDPALPDLDEPINGLAYCPGTINLKPFTALKPGDFQSDWQVNVMGLVHILNHYYRPLKKADHASVVAFSTVAVQAGMAFHASVAASKGAVEGMVRSLAAEWAPDIRVNAVAPSLTDTPMASRLLSNDKRRKQSEERHPMQRIGEPSDIARAARYLLTEESDWVTGQIMHVDGGLSSLRG